MVARIPVEHAQKIRPTEELVPGPAFNLAILAKGLIAGLEKHGTH